MIKFKTGDIYFTHDQRFIKIVKVSHELLAMSVHNKCITVECLDTFEELNLSYAHLDTWGIKYLGNNEEVARVLYGSNLKKELKHEEPINSLNSRIIAGIIKRQDDQGSGS